MTNNFNFVIINFIVFVLFNLYDLEVFFIFHEFYFYLFICLFVCLYLDLCLSTLRFIFHLIWAECLKIAFNYLKLWLKFLWVDLIFSGYEVSVSKHSPIDGPKKYCPTGQCWNLVGRRVTHSYSTGIWF